MCVCAFVCVLVCVSMCVDVLLCVSVCAREAEIGKNGVKKFHEA